MPKKATSVRLTPENEAKIKALAKREGLTMGHVMNMVLASYSGKREEGKDTTSPESKEIISRFDVLEKELAMQRQRINILKNQIDYMMKSQYGKGRTDKRPGDNKTE